MSGKTVEVVATSHVRHNGVHYPPGATIRMSVADANRLAELGVARIEAKPQTPPLPPIETGPELIAGLTVREATEALTLIKDPEFIREVLEIEQAKESPRSTLVEAAQKRLAELGGGE